MTMEDWKVLLLPGNQRDASWWRGGRHDIPCTSSTSAHKRESVTESKFVPAFTTMTVCSPLHPGISNACLCLPLKEGWNRKGCNSSPNKAYDSCMPCCKEAALGLVTDCTQRCQSSTCCAGC